MNKLNVIEMNFCGTHMSADLHVTTTSHTNTSAGVLNSFFPSFLLLLFISDVAFKHITFAYRDH